MNTSHRLSGTALAAQRRVAVDQALTDIRRIANTQPLDRAVLGRITARLEKLAGLAELFTSADFPQPAVTEGVGASTRYRLNPEDGNEDLALYLNSINPGKTSIPHNHTTWAAIVAVQGQEENRIYRRTDDGSDPAVARLAIARQVTVQPGTPIAFLPDDLHSIHVIGDRPTLHFHLYGRPLETLSQRIGVNLETGAVVNYNATQLKPGKAVA
ncbi:cysteine dioxygenase family protein [Variovorax paradoxus]|uniref:cysteine dioxygenase family protein n=1 Tax=Variovorax paradoxus TaxID=34073 RepID=UPI00278AD304|nr:cysteine dioxygenase family protein [Variovorax paradoxus]MDP9928151.1 putative metal-dependent enzyme (double-stranded beta helix superfamily) [Variovorax paradoxus]